MCRVPTLSSTRTMVLGVQQRPSVNPVGCAPRLHEDLEGADVDVQAQMLKEVRIVKVPHRDREGHVVLVVMVDYLPHDSGAIQSSDRRARAGKKRDGREA